MSAADSSADMTLFLQKRKSTVYDSCALRGWITSLRRIRTLHVYLAPVFGLSIILNMYTGVIARPPDYSGFQLILVVEVCPH